MNLTVRVGAAPWPPDVSGCIQRYPENCSHRGAELNTIWQLLTYVGFKVHIIPFDSFEDIDEALLRDEIDIVGATSPLESKDYTQYSATSPFIVHDFAFFYQNIQINKADSLTSTLDQRIMFWMAIISIILFTLAQLQHILSHRSNGKIPKELTGYRLAEAGWSLAAVVVCGVYCNGLAIGFYRTDFKAPFVSLDDLSDKISSGSCRLIVEPDALIYNATTRNFSSKALDKFAEVLNLGRPYVYIVRNRDVSYIGDVFRGVRARYGSCAVILDYDVRYQLYQNEIGSSIGMFIPEEFHDYFFVFYYRKNMDPVMDSYITMAAAAGSQDLYQMNLKDYYSKMLSKKFTPESDEESSRQMLNINFLSGSFYFLLGGLGIGLVVFLIEARIKWCKF